MYFRSQRKLQGEVSLSDAIDTDKEGGSLYLLDVVGTDDTMLSDPAGPGRSSYCCGAWCGTA